jgi:N-acyl-phosphatidylethanolamine-hydrolysing phospholipase D
MWSNLHAPPADAVRMFKDMRAKKALAIQWG